ncbi:MAG: hypothetical protein LCH96_18770 [Actinobacteria bacterium]|nr:hypothetical protein [Actinomycetota bacterium]
MSLSTVSRETTHPPTALTHRGLVDHGATRLGLWLLHWAKRSQRRHTDRVLRRSERLARQAEFDRLMDAISDHGADRESTLVLRALR